MEVSEMLRGRRQAFLAVVATQLALSCVTDANDPLLPPGPPPRLPETAEIRGMSRDEQWAAVVVPPSTLLLVDLRLGGVTTVTERLATLELGDLPIVRFTRSGGLYFSESTPDGTIAPVVFDKGARIDLEGAARGRVHRFSWERFPPALVFVGDRDVAVWSDRTGDITVYDKDAPGNDLFVFPSGELQLPGSFGQVGVFDEDYGLVHDTASGLALASIEGLSKLPEVRFGDTDFETIWCGFDEDTLHRVDLRTGELRSNRVAEVKNHGRVGDECVAIVRLLGKEELVFRALASAGVRDLALPRATEMDGLHLGGHPRRFVANEEVGFLAVEGRAVFSPELRREWPSITIMDAAPFDDGSPGIIATQWFAEAGGSPRRRLVLFGVDGTAEVIDEVNEPAPENPCSRLFSYPYVARSGVVANEVVGAKILKCEAGEEVGVRWVVIDVGSRSRRVLGGRDLAVSGSHAYAVWGESKVLVLEPADDEQGMLQLLQFPL